MIEHKHSRRNMLRAGLAGLGLLGTLPMQALALHAREPIYQWRGSAMHVPATILVHGPEALKAQQLAPLWQAELRRLDRIFSLYRPNSSLRELNRHGGLDLPPPELVELLSACSHIHRATGGMFDPTVQVIWDLYASHFGRHPDDTRGPPADALARARERLGFERVTVSRTRIELPRADMALTLNGIAQGYLSDRIAALLARSGIRHALVDIGEVRALAPRADNTPWRVGIARPVDGVDATEPGATIALSAGAVATSSPAGFRFAGQPRHHHLFDTTSGASSRGAGAVTVKAPTAALADGLSTAFAMMPSAQVAAAVARLTDVSVHFHTASPHPYS